MENRIAIVHEGWERNGKRVQLKRKRYYLHQGDGDFCEGFGDFLVRHYDIDEQTWLVVGETELHGLGNANRSFTGAYINWTAFMWLGISSGISAISTSIGMRFEKPWRQEMATH